MRRLNVAAALKTEKLKLVTPEKKRLKKPLFLFQTCAVSAQVCQSLSSVSRLQRITQNLDLVVVALCAISLALHHSTHV